MTRGYERFGNCLRLRANPRTAIRPSVSPAPPLHIVDAKKREKARIAMIRAFRFTVPGGEEVRLEPISYPFEKSG